MHGWSERIRQRMRDTGREREVRNVRQTVRCKEIDRGREGWRER